MYKRDENHQTFWNSRGMTTMCVSSNPPISVSEKIAQIKTWSNQYMEEIALLKNEKSRFLLRCSVIDAFSQSAFPNSHHTSSSFSSFLEKFSEPSYSDILKMICPITLYYNYHKKYNLGNLHLDTRYYGKTYSATDSDLSEEAQRLLKLIPNEKDQRNAAQKHTYSRLIYQRRNKIAHEFYAVGLPLNFQEDRENQLPHIVLSHEFIGEDLIPGHWELNIPEQFTTSVFLSAIKGYLSYCEQNQILPFKPESERAYRFSWYDK